MKIVADFIIARNMPPHILSSKIDTRYVNLVRDDGGLRQGWDGHLDEDESLTEEELDESVRRLL